MKHSRSICTSTAASKQPANPNDPITTGTARTYLHKGPLHLENGQQLPELQISYTTYGQLNKAGDNVIWVCHALTGNSSVLDWWPGLFGKDCLFDPAQYFIICANTLGSCYGSTGPLSIHPHTGEAWFAYFPMVTIRDMVQAHELLRKHLAIERIHTLIGGSLGAQQAIEWMLIQPELFEQAVLIAGNARHSAWGIAFNESQRMAVKADRTYYANSAAGGKKGLAAARSIALLSYRHYDSYCQKQAEPDDAILVDFRAASYQRYQGYKLCERFNAYSYVTLLNAMDSHHLGRGRGHLEETLARVKTRSLIIGITSDLLFPLQEQLFLARHIPKASLRVIDSAYGHDGFLLETAQLSDHISRFLRVHNKRNTSSTLNNYLR